MEVIFRDALVYCGITRFYQYMILGARSQEPGEKGEHKVRPYYNFITSTIHPPTFPKPSTQTSNFKLQTSNSGIRSREKRANTRFAPTLRMEREAMPNFHKNM
jgi:hypothetical protein